MRVEGGVRGEAVCRHRVELVLLDAPVAHLEAVDAALAHESLELGEEVRRLGGVGVAHEAGHLDVALVAGVGIDHVPVISTRDHDEAGAVGQVVVVRAHGVLGAVAAAAAGGDHGVAAEGVREGELGAGGEVGAVVHAGGEGGRGVRDARAADHVAHEVAVVRDEALDAVEQRVEALVRRQARGHGEHELGVDDGEHRHEARVAQAELLVALLAGDHGAGVDLGAGAGRGGHAHERQRVVLDGQALGRAAHDVVPDVARGLGAVGGDQRVGGHGADALAAVHDRAAAEGEHEVAALGAREPAAVVDGLAQRVRLDAVEQHVRDAGAVELGERAVEVAVGLDGLAARGHDQGALAGELLVAELGELPGAEEHAGLGKERVRVKHGFPLVSTIETYTG